MRKPCYTKIRNLLSSSVKMYAQATENEVFLSEGHLIIRMPDWLYRSEFLEPDAKNWPGTFPVLYPGDRVTRDGYDILEGEGMDLVKMWSDSFDRVPGGPVRLLEPMKHAGRKVQVLETERDKVLLNHKFFEAMQQATRCAMMYAGIRREPVWFYDDCEIWRSCFSALVLPVNYSELQEAAA